MHLGEDLLVPDVAGWRRARMPAMGDVPYFTMEPDWVCEVLSPSTSKIDRTQKLPIYARERVMWVWLIDPMARTLEVLRREGSFWQIVGTFSDGDRVRAEPFGEFDLDLAILWADVQPPT